MGIRSTDNYTVMDINNIRINYGPYGIPQVAVISYLYELPLGKGKRLLGQSARSRQRSAFGMATQRHHDVPFRFLPGSWLERQQRNG